MHSHASEYEAFDDVSSESLVPSMVLKARSLEMEFFRRMGVYEKVPRSLAKIINKQVIIVRWIDVNDGDSVSPDYRSRLVAKYV